MAKKYQADDLLNVINSMKDKQAQIILTDKNGSGEEAVLGAFVITEKGKTKLALRGNFTWTVKDEVEEYEMSAEEAAAYAAYLAKDCQSESDLIKYLPTPKE